MRREIERSRKIPAFSIDLADLEVMFTRIEDSFDRDNDFHARISITLPSETLEFDGLEELKSYTGLKGTITDFSFSMSDLGKRRLSFYTVGGIFDKESIVRAYADNEAWCAGVIDVVYTYLGSHRAWYYWLFSAPVGWILPISLYGPLIGMLFIPKEAKINIVMLASWATIVFGLGFLLFFRIKIFHPASLRISEEEGFIRRHAGELSLAIALLSVVLTIVGWFIKR